MSQVKVMSHDRAVEKLAHLMVNCHTGSPEWEEELAAALQSFAVKYHQLAPEVFTDDFPNPHQNPRGMQAQQAAEHPSTLWHQFFVKSLQNMLDTLPTDLDELKEALDAFDFPDHPNNNNNAGGRSGNLFVRTFRAGFRKVAKVKGVTKLTVSLAGLSSLRGVRAPNNVNGGINVLEFNFSRPTMVAARQVPWGRDAAVVDEEGGGEEGA